MKAKYFAKEVAFVDKYGNNYAYLEDDEIINLYWLRDERAIAETDKKYRKYLFSVAYDILHNAGDCEECINDTYVDVWNSIPPAKPNLLKSFITAIMRRIAINAYYKKSKKSSVPTEMTVSLSELEACVCSADTVDGQIDAERLGKVISNYLHTLSPRKRYIFIARYYSLEPIDKIAKELSLSRSSINKELSHIKEGLRKALESEDFYI